MGIKPVTFVNGFLPCVLTQNKVPQFFRYVYTILTVISPFIVAVLAVLLTQLHLVMTTKAKILGHLER